MKKGKLVQCVSCGNEIYRPPKRLKAKMFFCNNACKSQHFRKGYQATCVICGERFEKPPAEQKRCPHHCCSIECRSEYNNKQAPTECSNCGQLLLKPPSLLKDDNFCLKECHDEFQDQKIEVACKYCGKAVYKSPIYVRRSKSHFCSSECSAKFCHNGNVAEVLFENLVKKLGVDYSRNDRETLWSRVGQYTLPNQRYKCELDFYFPAIEFAVEINGRSHSSPIYGSKTLLAPKKRDSRKRRMCKQAGIKLRTVWIKDPSVEVMTRKFKTVVREIKQFISEDDLGIKPA